MADQQNEESSSAVEGANDEEVEELEWSADQEVLLLYSLHGFKPVGRDKHFHMMVIKERLSNAMNKNVSSKAIWDKLNSWYDLEALDEAEAEADAAEAVEMEFFLPEDEFGTLMNDKIKGPVIKVEKIQAEPETLEPRMVQQSEMVEVKQEPEDEEDTSIRRMNRSKTATPVKDQMVTIKKEKETPKKELAGRKEIAKESRKGGKEEDKKEGKKPTQEIKKDAAKEDKRDLLAKTNKRESTDKKLDKKEEKEVKKEVKKSEVSKTPKQTRDSAKQTKTKAEPPKAQKTESKKDVAEKKTVDKKMEAEKKAVEKKVEVKVEKIDLPRGAKLRTRGGEKKDEPERPEASTVAGAKRPRKSSASSDEPASKKMKGRTRNSMEPTPQSPPRRRTRVS